MTTSNPSGSYGPDDSTDLVRSVALSSVRLWEEVLERLARVELAQAELTRSLARLQAELPTGAGAASLGPGIAAPLAPPPPGLDTPPPPHFVAPPPPPQGFGAVPPPPPPPGFQSWPVDAVAVANDDVTAPPPPPPPGFGPLDTGPLGAVHAAAGFPGDHPVEVPPVAGEELATGPVPVWSDSSPPPPSDATAGPTPVDAGAIPPPPSGFQADFPVEPPPPPPGFQDGLPVEPPPPPPPPPGFDPLPSAGDDLSTVPAGFSPSDLSGLGAIGEPPPPPGFATTAEPSAVPSAPPPGPPPSAPPGFSVAELSGSDAIGAPEGMSTPEGAGAPPPPPGFSAAAAPAGTGLDGPATSGAGYGSDPFGDLLGDLDSADASAGATATPATGGTTPPPPPGFSTTGGGSFADLPIITPEPAADSSDEGAGGGAPPSPMTGRESRAGAPQAEPPITPDFFARAGRRKR